VWYALLGSALAVYGVLVGGLYVFQRHLLYFPDVARPELGDLAALGVREATLKTVDGLSLLSWYLPPHDGRPVIAYLHGMVVISDTAPSACGGLPATGTGC
jgi:hypothetical protein